MRGEVSTDSGPTDEDYEHRPRLLPDLHTPQGSPLEAIEDEDEDEMPVQIITDPSTGMLLRIPAFYPERTNYLGELGNGWLGRYQEKGEIEFLEAAISMFQGAIETIDPDDDPFELLTLAKDRLANAFRVRFERSAGTEDLDAAIELHEEVLRLNPGPIFTRAMVKNNLAIALHRR